MKALLIASAMLSIAALSFPARAQTAIPNCGALMAESQGDQKKGPVMTWADGYMRQNHPEMLANAVTAARAAVGLDMVCHDPSRAAFPLDKVIDLIDRALKHSGQIPG